MKKMLHPKISTVIIGATLILITVITSSWKYNKNEGGDNNKIPGITSSVNTSFASVDAETETLVPGNRIYHRSEALELKKSLESMYLQNPQSLAVNLALVKYHTCAPNFAGGFKGIAMQHAANIYRLNAYVGCMAYEYIYAQNNDYTHAHEWYSNSLACRVVDGMEWREVTSSKQVAFGIGVKGNFSNGKVQHLYTDNYGTHKRKIMMQKCNNNDCVFTLVPDYMRGSNSQATGKLIFTPF
jgi:hypothetical protein